MKKATHGVKVCLNWAPWIRQVVKQSPLSSHPSLQIFLPSASHTATGSNLIHILSNTRALNGKFSLSTELWKQKEQFLNVSPFQEMPISEFWLPPHIQEIHSRTWPFKNSHFSPSSPVQKGALPSFELETEKISSHPANLWPLSEQKPGVLAEVNLNKYSKKNLNTTINSDSL